MRFENKIAATCHSSLEGWSCSVTQDCDSGLFAWIHTKPEWHVQDKDLRTSEIFWVWSSILDKILTKIILSRISEADLKLWKQQTGFCKGKGCADHIVAISNITEQCTEWQRSLYINFIEFQKAFHRVHRAYGRSSGRLAYLM